MTENPFERSETLLKYRKEPSLNYSDLADSYLEISRYLNKILMKYPTKYSKLKKGFFIASEDFDLMETKNTNPPQDMGKYRIDKEALWRNKEIAITKMQLYSKIMLENRAIKTNTVLSIVAMVISLISVGFTSIFAILNILRFP